MDMDVDTENPGLDKAAREGTSVDLSLEQCYAQVFERDARDGSSEMKGDDFGRTASVGAESGSLGPRVLSNGESGPRSGLKDTTSDLEVVEIIDVDDSDDDPIMTGFESDGSSTKGRKPIVGYAVPQPKGRYQFATSHSTTASFSPDEESDSDDCLVLESMAPKFGVLGESLRRRPHQFGEFDGSRGKQMHATNVQTGMKAPVQAVEDEDNDESDSDVELVGAPQSDIRRMWEEAALRRRMGRAMESEESKAGGEHECPAYLDAKEKVQSHGVFERSGATSCYRGGFDSQEQTKMAEARSCVREDLVANDYLYGASSMYIDEEQPRGIFEMEDDKFGENTVEEAAIGFATADANNLNATKLAGPKAGRMLTEPFGVGDTLSTATCSERNIDDASGDVVTEEQIDNPTAVNARGCFEKVNPRQQYVYSELEEFGNEQRQQQADCSVLQDEARIKTYEEDLLAGKERLKQTLQYRRTDAAEWASRQLEIKRQATEAKKKLRRKKQESKRKMETERKQKERVDELRLIQQKEERNRGLKEQIRGQVRAELEHIVSSCNDFATVLRQLGIVVEGGMQPSTQQVKDAYNIALKKFHPDRVVASNLGDPRNQVEAEEKCKLILRLKKTFSIGNCL